MTEAASNRRPKQSGLAPLCFDAPIEAEFRAHYAARNKAFLRTAAALGFLLVGVVALLDWRLRAAELAAYWPLLRLGMAIPLLLVLLGTYPGALSRQLGVWSVLAAIAMGGGSAWLLASTSGSAAYGDLAGIYAVTMFIYLLLGLRLVAAVAVTVPLALVSVWILSRPWAGLAATEHAILLLVFVNVVGALSCYRLEHAARTAFLERQIVHILSATDSVTGVPNRRYFDTQLQRIRRQAQRESGGLAVARPVGDQHRRLRP